MILYVDRKDLGDLPEYGLVPMRDVKKKMNTIRNNVKYGKRDELETDPTKKQIIPYFLVVRGNELFTYKRLKGQSEDRLHNKVSLGFGGHIELEDGIGDPLMNGLMRELNEELFVPYITGIMQTDIVNDDKNEVGSVHLGVVYFVTVSGDVKVREVDKIEGKWENVLDINRDSLETWSEIIYDSIFK